MFQSHVQSKRSMQFREIGMPVSGQKAQSRLCDEEIREETLKRKKSM